MSRAIAVLAVLALAVLVPAGAQAAPPVYTPGAPGLGDEYFPLDGGGGIDVQHYDLDLRYDPATDELTGVAKIRIRATQNLSRFNLDFDALTVRSVSVTGGGRTTWRHANGELTITPRHGIRDNRVFTVTVVYDGVPETLPDTSGFMHTDDGALALGQPHGASYWYPVNDHPSDKASYEISITVPEGLEAISNGRLQHRTSKRGMTTWTWVAQEEMASYLAMIAIGEFDVRAYREDGLRFWDAVDPRLNEPIAPRTGTQFALSQPANLAYKRLARTIAVPASGGELTFWVNRSTEPAWDFFFVEAHVVGTDDWTTLPDANGNTSQDTGNVCPYWLGLHPFLERYQTATEAGCDPEGTTGEWHAASGGTFGYEQWRIDLSRFAGQTIELSLSYASDDIVAWPGVFVDDIVGPGGQGTTSFEADGNTMDGWTVLGPPAGSEPNTNDWIVGTAADAPEPFGATIDEAFARQGEVLDFLEGIFGPYPFSTAGGVVDVADISFALETQTRPVYSPGFFDTPENAIDVVVHELAHQWAGDHLTIARWRDIWLNEGFATYMEWLWSEAEGRESADELFESLMSAFPEEDPFWEVIIGHPQSEDLLFDTAVYFRGAMTLHALRREVGDDVFFEILRTWVAEQGGGWVTTEEFIATAERVSGRQLDDFFQTWLYTPEKPAVPVAAAAARSAAAALLQAPAMTETLARTRRR